MLSRSIHFITRQSGIREVLGTHSQGQMGRQMDYEQRCVATLVSCIFLVYTVLKGLERLLRKMILPNADLRITASVALNDPYFDPNKPEIPRKYPKPILRI